MQRIRLATYNIHKCKGMDGRTRPARVRDVLREVNADVIALQEVICVSGGSAEADQGRYLADQLEMHYALGETRQHNGGAYGNVVLSRWQLRSSCSIDISVQGRERRGCLRFDILVPAKGPLHVFNVHLGTSFFERRQQGRKLLEKELLKSNSLDGPRVVLGDFNEWTKGLASKLLSAELKAVDLRTRFSYPGLAPFLHLDQIYYDSSMQLQSARLQKNALALIASDHLPLVADFCF